MLERPTKYQDVIAEIKVKCKCGHTKIIPVYVDRIICNYCGHWVYRTPKLEFEYKIREEIKKNDNK